MTVPAKKQSSASSFSQIFWNMKKSEKTLLFVALAIIMALITFSMIGKSSIRIDPLRSKTIPPWGVSVTTPSHIKNTGSSNPCQEKRLEKYLSLLSALQFPSSCDNPENRYLIYELKQDRHEFPEQMKRALFAADWAFQNGRTFLFKEEDDWLFLKHSKNCVNNRGHGCVFLPPSNCSERLVAEGNAKDRVYLSTFMKDPEERVAYANSETFSSCKTKNPLCIGLPDDWHKCPNDPSSNVLIAQWASLFLSLILQPNEKTMNFIETRKREILFSHPITGVHIGYNEHSQVASTEKEFKQYIQKIKEVGTEGMDEIMNIYLSTPYSSVQRQFEKLVTSQQESFRILTDLNAPFFEQPHCVAPLKGELCEIDFNNPKWDYEAILYDQVKLLTLLNEADSFVGTKNNMLDTLVRSLRFSPWDHRKLKFIQLVEINLPKHK